MPLEDLTGAKYITDLNELWPVGTDYPNSGDDHIRGVKNVLRNAFPNISGAVTRTHTELNTGSVPAGSVCVFYQASAPAGWVRATGLTSTWGLRVVATASSGGVSGGSMDPVLNNVVPSHLHGINLDTFAPSQSTAHTHTGTTSTEPAHTHLPWGGAGQFVRTGGAIGAGGSGGFVTYDSTTNPSGAHAHTITTGATDVSHSHHISGNTANNVGGSAWTPRYLDVILCQRS